MTMNREQAMAVGALSALVMGCMLLIGLSFYLRADAAQELASDRAMLSQLEARARSGPDARNRSSAGGVAGPAAFLSAPTQGLASAQLQSYLSQLAANQNASVVSSAVEPPGGDDPAESIRIQATLEIDLTALQSLLYELESGMPYIFVDSLDIQTTAAAQESAQNPRSRVIMSLRGFWRRGAA